MKVFVNNPKNQAIIFLFLLFLIASSGLGLALAFFLLITCVGFAVSFDILFSYLRKRAFFFPRSGVITGLILTLIIDSSAQWYQIALICCGAMALKNFLRIGGRHIFNPAASGLFVGWIFFGLYPSWWAPSFTDVGRTSLLNILIIIPLILFAYVSYFRYRKFPAAITFFIVSFLLILFTNFLARSSLSLSNAFLTIFNLGTIFYTVVMLVEPMTSPVQRKRQIYYGAFVAGVMVLLVVARQILQFELFDQSLTALLLGNLLFFKYR